MQVHGSSAAGAVRRRRGRIEGAPPLALTTRSASRRGLLRRGAAVSASLGSPLSLRFSLEWPLVGSPGPRRRTALACWRRSVRSSTPSSSPAALRVRSQPSWRAQAGCAMRPRPSRAPVTKRLQLLHADAARARQRQAAGRPPRRPASPPGAAPRAIGEPSSIRSGSDALLPAEVEQRTPTGVAFAVARVCSGTWCGRWRRPGASTPGRNWIAQAAD